MCRVLLNSVRDIFNCSLILLIIPWSLAHADDYSSTVRIKVTVQEAGCSFSNESPVRVEFGDVYINEIDGEAYKKPVLYNLTCKGESVGKTLQMQVSGSGASFNGNDLKTDADGLGIKLLSGSNRISLNQWFDIDISSPPSIYAILEKQRDATFRNGQEFNASAILKVAYN